MDGTRTHDHSDHNRALYQLSYHRHRAATYAKAPPARQASRAPVFGGTALTAGQGWRGRVAGVECGGRRRADLDPMTSPFLPAGAFFRQPLSDSHSVTALECLDNIGRRIRTMRRIGIIGGMSWESTLLYYRLINERVRAVRGGLASAPLLIHSVDFAPVAAMQAAGDWAGLSAMMQSAGRDLAAAGAEAIAIATNTMHKLADEVAAASGLPVLHVADVTAAAIRAAGLTRVTLLGTRFTMEQDFYRQRLTAGGLTVLTPDEPGRAEIHRVIYDELCQGIILDSSRARFRAVIDDLRQQGSEGVILGCTEISMLIGPNDSELPLFDTTALHAAAIADACMG
jgi:aspartate racemase